MTRFSYTLMTEQSGPRELVRYAVAAEEAGFDVEVSNDHYSPWLTSQEHAPYAWTVLGAVAHATERVDLMTYVTGDLTTYDGSYFRVDSARIWDLPEDGVPIGVAVSGPRSIERFAPRADQLVAVEPRADLVQTWDGVTGASRIGQGARAVGQIPINWDPSSKEARRAGTPGVPVVRRRV